jgi:hypothetical protein
MKADYITPHEGTGWHQNDFRPGEQYVTDDRVFTCLTTGIDKYGDVALTVSWDDGQPGTARVWPNIQWIALNWVEIGDGE